MVVGATTCGNVTLRTGLILLALAVGGTAHDVVTTSLTFNKEIVRIVHARCARCHRDGGTAFSLMTYKEARPWAQAIKEEILSRRMPPWGAVKGFGEFRNDEGLSNEQVETILAWIDGGVPEGDEIKPPDPPSFAPDKPLPAKPQQIVTERGLVLTRRMKLDGLLPIAIPPGASMRITAVLPGGAVEPLVWLDVYQEKFAHPFLLEEPLTLPAGTRIEGVAPGAKVGLLAAKSSSR